MQPRLITALVTPFAGDVVNLSGLKENIAFQLKSGVHGLLALGTTGESPTLTSEERRAVITATVDAAAAQVPVWVGTGTNSTHSTIELTKEAQSLGADVALVVTPYYNCPTQEGLYQHYRTLCDAVTIPICVYTVPKRTGCHVTSETLARISELPNVIGIKDASGDVKVPHDHCIKVWSGDDAITLPLMSLGAIGVISVASNVIPAEMRALVDAAAAGDFDTARQLFLKIAPILEALFIETNPIPVKAAMEMLGMAAGPCRLPLCEMSSENRHTLHQTLSGLVDHGCSKPSYC